MTTYGMVNAIFTARRLSPPEEPKPEDELEIMEEFGWTEENLEEVAEHDKEEH